MILADDSRAEGYMAIFRCLILLRGREGDPLASGGEFFFEAEGQTAAQRDVYLGTRQFPHDRLVVLEDHAGVHLGTFERLDEAA
jgi:hypothetical protein